MKGVNPQSPSQPREEVFGVVVRDLMFQSRIVRACKELGVLCEVLRAPESAEVGRYSRLIVDLSHEGVLEWLEGVKKLHSVRVMGFVSHTDVQTIARARAAGVDRIFSRGAFTRLLPQILRGDLPQDEPQDVAD
jgi:hypothetical protein